MRPSTDRLNKSRTDSVWQSTFYKRSPEPAPRPASIVAHALASASLEDLTPLTTSKSSLSTSTSTASSSTGRSQHHIPPYLRPYEGKFQNRRGQMLYYFALFPPEEMPMRGVVLCLHGIGDHCRRHIPLYERLCEEGFGVISYDLLNHGASDFDSRNTKAHVSNFRYLVDDTNAFITFAKKSIYNDALKYWREHHHPHHPHGRQKNYVVAPELPLIIAGTSFGSLIGLHTVLTGRHKFHAGIWASPTIGVSWTPLLWAESKLAVPLAALFPTAKVVPAVQYELLCRDPGFLDDFKADPLTCMDMMTSRSGHECLQAMVRLQEDERVSNPDNSFCAVPMLFLAGSDDGIADQQAAIKFFASMGNLDKEFKLFDGLFHLVFEDPEKEDVLQYLAQWLQRRFPVETRH
ncbi:Serine protease [Phytophthora megakarya]|uniref:Serine protease n=1 Tax=Phytophthora megakarya TaxID=4795 RepID=A0A225VFV2_9STRA|nr:Serine protease [Phytophthora megakarya]